MVEDRGHFSGDEGAIILYIKTMKFNIIVTMVPNLQ